MPNFALVCILCVTIVRSFPLKEIGKNALVLKRVARQNNYIVQTNLISTQFYKSSNMSALLDAFYENYDGSNEANGKNVNKNDEDHDSYNEDEINFNSEARNNDENDVKATNQENIENASDSEEDKIENESTEEKKVNEKNNNQFEKNSIDNDENHDGLNTSISNYINTNSEEGGIFGIEKDQKTNFKENDTPNNTEVSESDEDYEDADEADYEHKVFGNDVDDDETNDDNPSEDFSNEDYNSNKKEKRFEGQRKMEFWRQPQRFRFRIRGT